VPQLLARLVRSKWVRWTTGNLISGPYVVLPPQFVKERRSEFVVSYYTGRYFLGREEHWCAWAEIPAENSTQWKYTGAFLPPTMQPVLAIVPQPIRVGIITIPAGLHFAFYDDRTSRTWCIYQRHSDLKELNGRNWIDVGLNKMSSWLELPPINDKLRSK